MFISRNITSFNMSLKILRTFVSKSEFSMNNLFKRKLYRIITSNRLLLENHTLQYQTKSNLQDKCNIKQSYLSKKFSTSKNQTETEFEAACNETLESLCDYFEQIIEDSPKLDNPDITYSDGVLTVQLGEPYGTYVINRQTPNKQIWLSSPKSGPKRYDFNGSKWIYKRDGVSLHELLTSELTDIFSIDVNFSECLFSGAISK